LIQLAWQGGTKLGISIHPTLPTSQSQTAAQPLIPTKSPRSMETLESPFSWVTGNYARTARETERKPTHSFLAGLWSRDTSHFVIRYDHRVAGSASESFVSRSCPDISPTLYRSFWRRDAGCPLFLRSPIPTLPDTPASLPTRPWLGCSGEPQCRRQKQLIGTDPWYRS
jgi:hypothetical protein